MKYINEFLSLRCAPDVLGVCAPINKAAKEISESMAVIRQIKPLLLKKPKYYTLLDFCAGNALTSVLAAHLYKVDAIAIDKLPRDRDWDSVRHFEYVNQDIYDYVPPYEKPEIYKPFIVIGVHPCKEVARDILIGAQKLHADLIVIMPCCSGVRHNQTQYQFLNLSKYDLWTLELFDAKTDAYKGKIIKDKNVLSPNNNLIVLEKNGNYQI